MVRRLPIVLAVPLLLAAGCKSSSAASDTSTASTGATAAPQTAGAAQKATAELAPTQGNDVKGTLTFEPTDGGAHVTGTITGLTPGPHGFHIHEKGDCSAPDGSSAGGHFNPGHAPHGAPGTPEAEHHAGDFGNIEADQSGSAKVDVMLDKAALETGEKSVIGRAVIVHANPDDLKTQPTGNAGGRVACGVIKAQ